jgi:hypothetical protein
MESSSDFTTGGMLTSIVDKWSSRVLEKEIDPSRMARWSAETMAGKKKSMVAIITGYNCVKNTSGDNSVWNQQKIFMRDRQSKQSPHPRKQFIQDLIVFIKARQNANHEIILNLDANEVLGEESQGIAKLMRECGLVDLLDAPELVPDEQLMDTYRRGTNR